MKGKRFLPILLLSASLLLTSCEDLLSGFMGGNNKKSSNNEDSENYGGGQGYQGKQGATELSKEEWDLAFSLEEFALRRSCHVEAGHSMSMSTMDVDNGKFLISVQGEEMGYFNFDKIENDMAYVTYYYKGENGSYMSGSEQAPLGYTMAEFGILEYDYNDFKYDSGSKSYKANSFHYEVSYMGQVATSINGSNAIIKIEDGFPKSVEFDFEMDGDEEIGTLHYTANYSNYNKTVVKLPDVNGGNNNNNNNIPELGDEITFAEFSAAFAKREKASFNHVVATVSSDSASATNYSFEATYYQGMWEVEENDNGFDQEAVTSLILDEETLAEMQQSMSQLDINFYHDSKKNTYSYYYSYTMAEYGISMSGLATYNSAFYAIYEVAELMGTRSEMEVEWSTISIPTTRVMSVANRTFVGVDIQETSFVYYQGHKATAEGISLAFDDNGNFKMESTKMNSGNEVQDYYVAYYGSYEQKGNSVTVSIYAYSDGENVSYAPAGQEMQIVFTVEGGRLSMPTQTLDANNQQTTLHVLFEFDEPLSEDILVPSSDDDPDDDDDDNEPEASTYYCYDVDYVVLEGGNEEEASAALARISKNDFVGFMAIFMEEDNSVILTGGIYGTDMGTYSINNDVISCLITASLNLETYEATPLANSYTMTFHVIDNENIYFEIAGASGNGYVIRALMRKIA